MTAPASEWMAVAQQYAEEYAQLLVREERRDENQRAAGEPVMRAQAPYRARVPFRALYQALKEAGCSDPAIEARRRADDAAASVRLRAK